MSAFRIYIPVALLSVFLLIPFSCDNEKTNLYLFKKWEIISVDDTPYENTDYDVKYVEFFENGKVLTYDNDEEYPDIETATWNWTEENEVLEIIYDGGVTTLEIVRLDKNEFWFYLSEDGLDNELVKCLVVQ
jgi:hypothetical protein